MIAPLNSRSHLNQIEKRYEEEVDLGKIPPELREVYFMGKIGLFNLGNTCYINSIIQCFIHAPMIKQYFLFETYKADLSKKSKNTLSQNICSLAKEIFNPIDDGPIWPDDLKTKIVEVMPMFEGCEQHDAHEVELISLFIQNFFFKVFRNVSRLFSQ
jgi:ubiquitin C-terminal hydrolase